MGIFIPASGRCSDAGRPGISAGTISRHCWCSPGNGATPRICRRRFQRRPGRCSAFSPSPPGTMTRWWGVSKSTWVRVWSIRKPFGCSAAAIFPSRGENRWELPGSTAADWARWPTARQGCSWRMSVPRAGHWWTSGCTSRRAGPRTRNAVPQRECLSRGGATSPSLS